MENLALAGVVLFFPWLVWLSFTLHDLRRKKPAALERPTAREYCVVFRNGNVAYRGGDILRARAEFRKWGGAKGLQMIRDGVVIREVS